MLNKNVEYYRNIFESYKEKITVSSKDLKLVEEKRCNFLKVEHRTDLANKYLGKFANCSEIEAEKDLKIIGINESVIFMHEGKVVGGIIRDVAKASVKNHFGYKMKETIKEHYKINR